MSLDIRIASSTKLKQLPPYDELGFGSHTTDHMFIVNYSEESSWHNAQIVPYRKIELDPTALVLHYAQAIFEGLKIYRKNSGCLSAFRPQSNARRLNNSAQIMSMPELPEDTFLQALEKLALIDQRWIPEEPGYSLYVRPTMIATQPTLGVQPSKEYIFYMILTPVPAYYKPDMAGFKLLASHRLSRTSRGDVSDAKTAGNYGKTITALEDAKHKGYDNILWLGGEGNNWIEEAGITNVFVRFKDIVATPPLNGRILPGITRETVVSLLKSRETDVVEKEISISELCDGIDNGSVIEVFMTGTATVVAPVMTINFKGVDHNLTPCDQPVSRWLYQTISDIQSGEQEDRMGWMHDIKDV
ncbi:branched-chain amino acid aminotransferase [Endozoicomonas acroporae]|uniref:branched-chain amino acid aminotransferase n=1 Tax=Endozoicomonas acroporae TaxID=1701104 RepID=UPI003D7A9180